MKRRSQLHYEQPLHSTCVLGTAMDLVLLKCCGNSYFNDISFGIQTTKVVCWSRILHDLLNLFQV